MEAGVYLISNSVNGKCYVGSTIHLDQRRKEHAKHIKEGQTGKSLTEEHYNTIQKRLKNPNFPNYYYVKFGAIPPKELSYNHDN